MSPDGVSEPPGWDIVTGDRERDRRNVSVLMESVEELYGPREMEELERRVVDRAIRVTGAQRGVLIVDGAGGAPRVAVARDARGRDLPADVKYSRTVTEQVRRTSRPHLTVDTEDPTVGNLGQSVLDLRLVSLMAVPLTVKGKSLGVLYVDSTVQAKEFTQADFTVFRALGGVAALAVENGRLLAERVVRERMSRDLATAREIQQSLQPREIAAPEAFDIAAEARPCEETSGDYFDVVRLPGDGGAGGAGRVALVMGDVSGHGLGPALMMASTRAMLHVLLSTLSDPSSVVGALNDFLERDMPRHSFVSLFLGILDPATRRLTWVNAGHNPPLHVRQDGTMTELTRTGLVLGVLPRVAYGVGGPVELGSGDAVVLYTDGVTEAKSPAGEMYGEDRFTASLRDAARGTAGARPLLDRLLGDLAAFTQGRAAEDDVTCLVLRTR
jgi:sigma-B regulation protein RsbU (phosphoserine phosphatase)